LIAVLVLPRFLPAMIGITGEVESLGQLIVLNVLIYLAALTRG
jgi:hypothetical protein